MTSLRIGTNVILQVSYFAKQSIFIYFGANQSRLLAKPLYRRETERKVDFMRETLVRVSELAGSSGKRLVHMFVSITQHTMCIMS